MPSKEALPFRPAAPQEPQRVNVIPGFNQDGFNLVSEFASVLQQEPHQPKVWADGSLDFGKGVIGPSEAERKHAEDIFQKMTSEGFAVVDQESPVGGVLAFGAQMLNNAAAKLGEGFRALDQTFGQRLRPIAALAAVGLVTAACGTSVNTPKGAPGETPTPEATHKVYIPIVGKDAQLPPPTETPTAVVATPVPGIGGGQAIPTFPPGHPRAGENPGIDAANEKDAKGRADTTATAPKTEKALSAREYFSQAERIQITRGGVTETYLALKISTEVPSPGVPFFAPEDGRLLDKVKESGDPFSGLSVSLLKPVPPGGAYVFIGLQVDNMLQVNNPKKDSIIGYGNSTGTKNYGADVLVTVTKRTPNGPATDEEALKELSPEAYKKPFRLVKQEGPGIPTVSISHDSTPPDSKQVQ